MPEMFDKAFDLVTTKSGVAVNYFLYPVKTEANIDFPVVALLEFMR